MQPRCQIAPPAQRPRGRAGVRGDGVEAAASGLLLLARARARRAPTTIAGRPQETPMPYLTAGNTSFRDAVYRTVGFQTTELKAVVKAVADYQAMPNVHQFRSLKEALDV